MDSRRRLCVWRVKAAGFQGERGRQVGGRVRARDLLRFNMGARLTLRHEHALTDAAPVYHVSTAQRVASEGDVGAGTRQRARGAVSGWSGACW